MDTYVIGDLQGCGQPFGALLQHIDALSPGSRLILAGDLVNRGPLSLATLRRVKDLGSRAEAVLGNHDLHLLAAAHGIRPLHPSDTLQEILDAPDRDDLLDWLRHRPLAIMEQGHLVVHAGVLPGWTAEQVLSLAAEVQAVLQSDQWVDFLRQMYGNTPARWDDSLQGADRLRCIVNALTRLRFCATDGTMEFTIKESAASAPAGFMPWFDVPGRKTAGTPIVFGHWSTLGLTMRDDLVSLDTGCVWGGSLSAVRLSDRHVIQVPCPQAQAPG